jgi:hypothetical protein
MVRLCIPLELSTAAFRPNKGQAEPLAACGVNFRKLPRECIAMSETEPKAVDLANLEKTLQASIKLMRKTRRSMERMRRKTDRHDGEPEAA